MGIVRRNPEAADQPVEGEQHEEQGEQIRPLEEIGRERIQAARQRMGSLRAKAGRFFRDIAQRTGRGLERSAYYAAASPEAVGRGASAVAHGVEAGAVAVGRGTQAAVHGVERGGAWVAGKTTEYGNKVADTFFTATDAAVEKGRDAYQTLESKVHETKAWAVSKKEGITQAFHTRIEQMRENRRIKKLLDIEKKVTAHQAKIDALMTLRERFQSTASRAAA